jgi:hypothetical protein
MMMMMMLPYAGASPVLFFLMPDNVPDDSSNARPASE